MSNIPDRVRGAARYEQRSGQVTPAQVDLAIQQALAEGDLLARLTKLETQVEEGSKHLATREYVLESVAKQTRWIVAACVTVAVSALGLAVTIAVRVLSSLT